MSTKGLLIFEVGTGMFAVSTICRDAYPVHMLRVLNGHFEDEVKAEQLVASGEILDLLNDGTFAKPRKPRTTRYFPTVEEIYDYAQLCDIEYAYLWPLHGDKWREVTFSRATKCLTFVRDRIDRRAV